MKILVVRFKLMGDSILSSALCHSLKLSFPNATVDYVTYAPYDQIFMHNDAIDHVFGIDVPTRKSPIKYLRFVYQIVKRDYDIIVDAQGTYKSNFFSLLSPSAKFRICASRKNRSLGTSHQIPKRIGVDKLDERLNLLTPLSEHFNLKLSRSFALNCTEEEVLEANAKLVKLGINTNRPLFVFAISANESFKKWCPLEFHDLVNHCRDRYGAQILLYHGLPKEQADVERFYSELGNVDDVFYGFQIDSLRCLPALFSRCDLFIGNEGGPRHIAHAVGTPSVSIFSPSARKLEWLPQNDPLHQGFEWCDVKAANFDNDIEFKVGDSEYFRRYNSIKADMIKPLIDSVYTKAQSQT